MHGNSSNIDFVVFEIRTLKYLNIYYFLYYFNTINFCFDTGIRGSKI